MATAERPTLVVLDLGPEGWDIGGQLPKPHRNLPELSRLGQANVGDVEFDRKWLG